MRLDLKGKIAEVFNQILIGGIVVMLHDGASIAQ